MKVFTQEVINCKECILHNNIYQYCNYMQKGTTSHWNTSKPCNCNKEINDDCPFNKLLTKEDIESFGFKKKGENYYKQKDEKFIEFYKRLWKHAYVIEIKTDDEETYIEVEVTSKPHLKFILQSLNII